MKAKIFVPILSVILVVSLLVSGYSIFGGFGGEVSIDPDNVEIVTNNDNMVAKEHPDFTVEEVEIIPPEGTNIALGKAVSDNGFQDVYVAKNAVDGNTDGASYWEGMNGEYPNELTVDLGAPASINAVRVLLCPLQIWGKRTQKFSVSTSDDGTNFTEVVANKGYEFDPKTGNQAVVNFDPEITTRYVRLSFTGNTGASAGQVAEFEVYSK